MNIQEIIAKKRDGMKLSKEEIGYFIINYTNGSIADYQASALIMAIYLNGMDEEEIKIRIEKALEAVNGSEFIDKPVQFLSYGQKKRVAIASVIAMQNETVLLDEPTSGLDPRSTDAVVEIIKNMKKNGTKVVISSHDMDLIYEICDYVYVMNKGEIIKEGNSDDVFMDEKMIKNAGLKTPWIIKIYNELKNNKTNNNETNLEIIKTKFAQYK